MPMDSETDENVAKLEKERGTKEMELQKVQSTSVQEMWTYELDDLAQEFVKFKEEKERMMTGSGGAKKVKKVAKLSVV